jgi:hypothetical protein
VCRGAGCCRQPLVWGDQSCSRKTGDSSTCKLDLCGLCSVLVNLSPCFFVSSCWILFFSVIYFQTLHFHVSVHLWGCSSLVFISDCFPLSIPELLRQSFHTAFCPIITFPGSCVSDYWCSFLASAWCHFEYQGTFLICSVVPVPDALHCCHAIQTTLPWSSVFMWSLITPLFFGEGGCWGLNPWLCVCKASALPLSVAHF